MTRRWSVISVVVTGLCAATSLPAPGASIETRDLVVSDATGKLSSDDLKGSADQAQAMLEKILALWSADSGMDRFGKIQVVFEPPRREVYSSVFYWEQKDGKRIRVVKVFMAGGSPQMMAHKLTSAVFPQKDKLVRNMMGILSEAHVGNPATFPMCGFSSDDWVLAFQRTKSYVPLGELGPDHESWGMKDDGGGKLSITDKARQHKTYAEAGSFGEYLFQTRGIAKIKQFHRLSQEKTRPWQEAFGAELQELESSWLSALGAKRSAQEGNVAGLLKLLDGNPGTACAEAQKVGGKER